MTLTHPHHFHTQTRVRTDGKYLGQVAESVADIEFAG